MHLRDRIQHHVAEDSAQPVHILVLKPGTVDKLEVQNRDPVLSLFDKWRQVKVRRREGILTVANILPVDPQGKACLNSLEGDAHAHALPCRGHSEISNVLRCRVESLRSFAQRQVLSSVPRILRVDISRLVISFHLDIGRNADLCPAALIILRLLEALDR